MRPSLTSLLKSKAFGKPVGARGLGSYTKLPPEIAAWALTTVPTLQVLTMLKKLLFAAAFFIATSAYAISTEDVKAITIGETDARVAALGKAMLSADDKMAAFLQALSDDAVKVAGDKVFVVKDGKAVDPVTDAPVALPDNAEDVINNNRMRARLIWHWLPSNCSPKTTRFARRL